MATATESDLKPARASTARLGGWVLVAGTVAMLVGAVFNFSSGAEADAALSGGDIAGYLTAADAAHDALVLNLGIWIVAICVICAGGVLVASASMEGPARTVSTFGFTTGAGTAVMFFSLWMAVVTALAPAHVAGADMGPVGHALLAAAVNADWVITVMILVVGGSFLVFSGGSNWAPRWLVVWATIGVVVGIVTLVALAAGTRGLLFPVVPVGLGLLIATGIVSIRRQEG